MRKCQPKNTRRASFTCSESGRHHAATESRESTECVNKLLLFTKRFIAIPSKDKMMELSFCVQASRLMEELIVTYCKGESFIKYIYIYSYPNSTNPTPLNASP